MQSVFLTGAHGFLGKYILQELKNSCEVDTLGQNTANNHCINLAVQTPTFNRHYDLVIHAAGLAHNKELQANRFFDVNVTGTKRICDAFDDLVDYPEHFVFISSVAVYGVSTGDLIDEDYPLQAQTPYALSKIAAEKIVIDWCTSRAVKFTILRLPLVAGKNAPGNFGALVKAINNNKFFMPGRGDARKSIVLAEDVAKLIAGGRLEEGVFNLTAGYDPSLVELTSAIAKQLNKKQPVHMPIAVAKLIAIAGDILGKKFPFNSQVLGQLNAPLTFSDRKARELLIWNPRSVIENLVL